MSDSRALAISERAASDVVLDVSDLRVEFQTAHGIAKAVNGVSFSLRQTETMAILGESGSGKSVTAEAVMGIVDCPPGRIASGSVLYRGIDLIRLHPRERRAIAGDRIAMIFQDPQAALDPAMSVGAQIAELFQVHQGLSRDHALRRAVDMMDRVQIPAARQRVRDYPFQFSGGMCQRIMIAMAVALDPDILIADEPTTALDVTIQAQVMRLLAELQAENGMSLILITHDTGVASEVADRVAVMYAGRIVETGVTGDVFSRPAHPYTAGLMRSVPRLAQKGRRLVPIPGAPPSPLRIPSGCSFHPRCPLARANCSTDDTVLAHVSEGRRSACHYASEVLDGRS